MPTENKPCCLLREKLYLADPMKTRVVLKYRHSDGNLCIKVTDDRISLVSKTEQAQHVRKIREILQSTNATDGSQGIPAVLPWKLSEWFEMKTLSCA